MTFMWGRTRVSFDDYLTTCLLYVEWRGKQQRSGLALKIAAHVILFCGVSSSEGDIDDVITYQSGV